jgi:LPS export ABC transporter protein LptC
MKGKGRPGFGRQRWWWLGLLLLVGLVSWGLWGRQAPPPPPPKPVPAAEAPARMETLSLTEIQDGDKRWVLEAQKADFQKERLEIVINGVRVEFFGPDEHLFIRADEGVLQTKTRVLTLRGQVEMEFGDLKATTDLAIYQPGGRVLLAPDNLTLETPRLKVQGKELRVELAAQKLVLAQHHLTEIKGAEWGLKP